MKRKKLVYKSIALGLAVATAATTMSVPGGVLNPTAVYAEEGDNTQSGTVRLKLEPIQGTSHLIQGVQISADGKNGTVYYVFDLADGKFTDKTADEVKAENHAVAMENGIARISKDESDFYNNKTYYLYTVLEESDGTKSEVSTAVVDATSVLDTTGQILISSSERNFPKYFQMDRLVICNSEEELRKGVPVTFQSKDRVCTQDDFHVQYTLERFKPTEQDNIYTPSEEKTLPEGTCPTETGQYRINVQSKLLEQKYYTYPDHYEFTNSSIRVVVKMDDSAVTVKYYDKDGNETPEGLVPGGYALIRANGYKKCGAYLEYENNTTFSDTYRYDYNENDANVAIKYLGTNTWDEGVSFFKDDVYGTEFYENIPITYAVKDNFEGEAYLDVNGTRADADTVVKEGDTLKVSIRTNEDENHATYEWYHMSGGNSIATGTEYTVTSEDIGESLTCEISNLGNNQKHTLYVYTGYVLSKDGSTVPAPKFGNLDMNAHTLTFNGKEGKEYVYSLDGGNTWTDITLDNSAIGTIPLGDKSYKAGSIQIRAKEGSTVVSYDKNIVVPLTGNVPLTGTEKYGQTITAKVTGTQEGAALKYTFIRVKDGTETVAQEASDKADYTIGKEDIGCTLKVKVTADGYDEGKPLESTETQIVKKADGRNVASVAGYMQQEGESYTYTVTPVPDAVYRMNDGDWQESNVFTGIKPGTQNVTFSAQIPEDDCYEAGEVKTSDPVSFAKLNREMPKLSYTVKDGENGSKIVTIDPVEGAVYYSNDGQTDSNVFTVPADKLEKVTIGIWLPETDIYLASKENKQTVNLSLETQTAPEAAVLTAKVNTAGTGYDIIVTEPKAEEGVTYEYSNTPWDNFGTLDQLTGLTNVAPGKEVVIYVRKAAVEGKKNASPVTACSIKTDLIKAEAPVITGPATFNGTATVTMTAAGKIYYTTDGSTPTVNSNLYTDAITIDKTTTIQAIAVENGKPVSDVASLTLTKISSGSGSGSSGSGSSGSGATTGTTTPAVKPDSKPETTTETKPDGTIVTTTTTMAEDGTKNVVVELKNEGKSSIATVTISKDAIGKTVKAEAVVTQIANKKVMSVSGALVAQITEAAGTKNVNVVTSVKDGKGAEIGTVTVNAEKLVAGKKLAIVKVNAKTGEKILVNAKNYKVAKDGSISVSGLKNGKYELVTTKEKTALSKKILKTVTAKNAKKTVKDGAKTTFAFGKDLNKENVKSVKYVSSKKSVAAIDKNGKIKAKKAGQTVVKAVVTLKDGTKKTVKTVIIVKAK